MISVSSPEIEIHPNETPTPPPATPSPENLIFRSRLPDIPLHNNLPLHTYCFQKLDEFAGVRLHLLLLLHTFRQFGHVILLLLPNCPEFAFTFLAASFLGAATTAANPFCTPPEIKNQFFTAGAKLVVTHSAYIHKLTFLKHHLSSKLPVITVDDPPAGCLPYSVLSSADETTAPDVSVNSGDTVALPFSSGTTGLPKGVELSHRSLVSSIAQQVDGENPNLYLKTGDVVLCVLPLFHIYSLNSVFLCSLRAGAAVLLMPKFEIAAMLAAVERHRVTVAAVVPPLVLALAKNPLVDKYDLSSIRFVVSGAAPLGKELEAALRCRLPHAILGQGYGMTEAGPVLSMCPAFAKRPTSSKSGSCGIIVRNAEMKVVDMETGLSLGRNKSGEICIRGPQIMKGYLRDPEATSATIDVEGWLHTGDIGYVDDDDEVFIVDGVKELINFKGFQVPPAELEALLVSHSSIVDAAVVSQKDEAAGEVPVAFIVRSNDNELTENEVKEFISKQVVFYKRLHKVYFVHTIPKSQAGKILRKELRAKLAYSAPNYSGVLPIKQENSS